MELIYGIVVRVFYSFMYAASFVNPKAKTWLKGQKQIVKHYDQNCIWIHCASLGEFKQAQPLVKLLKKDGYKIVFTFFSPSGYAHAKSSYPIYYLPLDTYRNAKHFLNKINPSLAIFVRSEYWFNHIRVLKERDTPLVIMNCYLNENQYFFKWYGKWFLDKIKGINFLYTINENTSNLLSSNGCSQNLNVGDTKVDQVIDVKQKTSKLKSLGTKKKIILGASLEPGDREVIMQIIKTYPDDFLLILVPHEHNPSTLNFYNKLAKQNLTKYSEINDSQSNIIYVDEFGILPTLFNIAWVSYIGGGFDKGIHNVLESCIEGKPMIFGPQHNSFPEAKSLMENKAAISIKNANEITNAIGFFKIESNYEVATTSCKEYINSNKGTSQTIYNHLKKSELI